VARQAVETKMVGHIERDAEAHRLSPGAAALAESGGRNG
jgi:hypothetical protein